MENPMKMDDLGVPLFLGSTPIWIVTRRQARDRGLKTGPL